MEKEKKKGRPDGLKRVSFTFNGKRYYCYGHTLKEARKKAEEREKELSEKKYKPSRDLTVSEYHDRWAAARQGTVKGATIRKQSFEFKAASNIVIDDAGTIFGDLKLTEVETQHIRILQKKLQLKGEERTRSTNTVNGMIALVSHIFHDAVNERILTWNPCNGVKPLKRTEKPARDTIHRALTKEETQAFFEAAKTSAYYDLYRFLINTGCRVGEAAAITLSDIKPNGIQIRRTVTKSEDGSYIIGNTAKTEHGKRFIPMTAAIKEVLNHQKEINESLYGSSIIKLDDPIFTSPNGCLIIASGVERDLARICKKIGLEKITAHCFRDTFATRAIESGMNPKTLQEILGHSDIGMTMNLYAHVMDDTKAEQMKNVIAL